MEGPSARSVAEPCNLPRRIYLSPTSKEHTHTCVDLRVFLCSFLFPAGWEDLWPPWPCPGASIAWHCQKLSQHCVFLRPGFLGKKRLN